MAKRPAIPLLKNLGKLTKVFKNTEDIGYRADEIMDNIKWFDVQYADEIPKITARDIMLVRKAADEYARLADELEDCQTYIVDNKRGLNAELKSLDVYTKEAADEFRVKGCPICNPQ
jgi:hypothetical protein